MFGALTAVAAASLVVTVDKSVEGQGVVLGADRVAMRAEEDGVVGSVTVARGDAVTRGQVMVSLQSAVNEAQLVRAQAAVESAVLELLRFGVRADSRQMATAQADLRAANIQRERALVRATEDGTVMELRVRRGQVVREGEVIATTSTGVSTFNLQAVLPGYERPRIRVGQSLSIVIQGYDDVRIDTPIDSIDTDVIGPAELARQVGPAMADVMTTSQSSIIVTARLQRSYIGSAGRQLQLFDGMKASVRLNVGREPVARFMWMRKQP